MGRIEPLLPPRRGRRLQPAPGAQRGPKVGGQVRGEGQAARRTVGQPAPTALVHRSRRACLWGCRRQGGDAQSCTGNSVVDAPPCTCWHCSATASPVELLRGEVQPHQSLRWRTAAAPWGAFRSHGATFARCMTRPRSCDSLRAARCAHGLRTMAVCETRCLLYYWWDAPDGCVPRCLLRCTRAHAPQYALGIDPDRATLALFRLQRPSNDLYRQHAARAPDTSPPIAFRRFARRRISWRASPTQHARPHRPPTTQLLPAPVVH